jgi:hypothetical protein
LARSNDLVLRIIEKLVPDCAVSSDATSKTRPVREPAGHSGNGEQHREEVGGKAHGLSIIKELAIGDGTNLVDDAGIKVYIGIEFALTCDENIKAN